MKGYGENSQPAATSDEYRKGYDKIFGKKEEDEIKRIAKQITTIISDKSYVTFSGYGGQALVVKINQDLKDLLSRLSDLSE